MSVSQHFYGLHKAELWEQRIMGRKQASDFWQQDLLAGLLMTTLLLYDNGKLSNLRNHPSRMADLAGMAASIDFNTADVDSSFLQVPGAATVAPATKYKWLHLLWNLLTIADKASKNLPPLADPLVTQLFGAFVAGSQARLPLNRRQYEDLLFFWHTDILVTSLLHLLKRHGSRRFAGHDAFAIQQWLTSHSPAAAPTPPELPRQPSQDLNHLECPDEAQLMPVKDVSIEDLRETVSATLHGISMAELAELEQQLICQYEVASCTSQRLQFDFSVCQHLQPHSMSVSLHTLVLSHIFNPGPQSFPALPFLPPSPAPTLCIAACAA